MAENPEQLAVQMGRLEERMKTMQAEYKTDIARLDAGLRADISRLAEDSAKRDTEATKRETRLTLTFTGLMISAVTILGVLIAFVG